MESGVLASILIIDLKLFCDTNPRVVAGGHLESDDWSLTWSPNLTSVFIRWNVRAILYLTAT